MPLPSTRMVPRGPFAVWTTPALAPPPPDPVVDEVPPLLPPHAVAKRATARPATARPNLVRVWCDVFMTLCTVRVRSGFNPGSRRPGPRPVQTPVNRRAPSTVEGGVETATSARDEELLRALHDEYAGALWSFVVHLTGGDRTRAQDVVQETLLRAWRHPE